MYWNEHPPTHVLLAGLLRSLGSAEEPASVTGVPNRSTSDEAGEFVKAFKRGA